MTIEEVKRCKGKCRELKPLSEFHKEAKLKDGRKPRCKQCTKEARPSRARVVKLVGVESIPVVPSRIKADCMQGWWL